MAQLVCSGAMLTCSFGVAPAPLNILPPNRVLTGNMPAGNILDYIPMTNVTPFGVCTTLSNPQVAAATAAASGVLTPMPCLPVTASPWTPGSPTVMIGSQPALSSSCQLMCAWGGVITVTNPGQLTVNVA